MKIVVLLLAILVNCAHQAPSRQGGNNYGIYDGQGASEGQFPYQAAIHTCYFIPSFRCDEICGGTIISPSWIVTSAQCYKSAPNMAMQIAVGFTDYSKINLRNTLLPVTNTFVHKDYVAGKQALNDIRLYQLRDPLVFTQLIQPIRLPKQNSDFTGEAVSTGWGSIGDDRQNNPILPNILQYQISNMPDGKRCADLTNAKNLDKFNVAIHVCTEHPEEGEGPCTTDVGGPLVQNGTLVGINSWVYSLCGLADVPSVFTRVSHYVDWITDRVTEPLIFN